MQLMRALVRVGLARPLVGGSGRERASLFFVKKPKKEKLRAIVDTRRANHRFRSPPSVALCTSEGLTRIELNPEIDIADP